MGFGIKNFEKLKIFIFSSIQGGGGSEKLCRKNPGWLGLTP